MMNQEFQEFSPAGERPSQSDAKDFQQQPAGENNPSPIKNLSSIFEDTAADNFEYTLKKFVEHYIPVDPKKRILGFYLTHRRTEMGLSIEKLRFYVRECLERGLIYKVGSRRNRDFGYARESEAPVSKKTVRRVKTKEFVERLIPAIPGERVLCYKLYYLAKKEFGLSQTKTRAQIGRAMELGLLREIGSKRNRDFGYCRPTGFEVDGSKL